MAAQFSDNDLIESEITYDEVEPDQSVTDSYDAVQYVKSVRNTFGGKAEEYLHFVALLSNFNAKRTSLPVLVSRLEQLFFKHQELIEGLNPFLPKENQVPLPRRSDTSFQETISYDHNKVKVFTQEKEHYVVAQAAEDPRESELGDAAVITESFNEETKEETTIVRSDRVTGEGLRKSKRTMREPTWLQE